MLIQQMSSHIQHMQKALSQMNIQLHNVISDITGETGMLIIRAIVDGKRDSKLLASYRNYRCKNSSEVIEKSLTGNYREEHLFSLSQALELFDTYQHKIATCDEKIENQLSTFEDIKTDGKERAESTKKTVKKSKIVLTGEFGLFLFCITFINLSHIFRLFFVLLFIFLLFLNLSHKFCVQK